MRNPFYVEHNPDGTWSLWGYDPEFPDEGRVLEATGLTERAAIDLAARKNREYHAALARLRTRGY